MVFRLITIKQTDLPITSSKLTVRSDRSEELEILIKSENEFVND
jgi:hypothetical protein